MNEVILNVIVDSDHYIDWITAIITLLAVLVALFGSKIIQRIDRPKIKIIRGDKEPFVVINYPSLQKYFRLKIKNEGKDIAKNCHLKLIAVNPIGDPNAVIQDPVPLKWSSSPLDSRYLIDDGQKPIFRETKNIPPEGWEFCDLFEVGGAGQIKFLSSLGKSKERSLSIGNTNYIAYIKIFGDNFKPKTLRVKILNNIDYLKIKILISVD